MVDMIIEEDLNGRQPIRRQKTIDKILLQAIEANSSDIILTVGNPPMFKRHGRVQPIEGWESRIITDEFMEAIIYQGILDERPALAQKFKDRHDLDCAYALVDSPYRFRVNLFYSQGHQCAILRTIPINIPKFDTLGLPPIVASFADYPRGLVLVTGPTGSGKSTTLASLIDLTNRRHHKNIITLEDPIEFVHKSRNSVISHREVGEDTETFESGMKACLRQFPDIILLGEMRDRETISAALTAAETGHLVMATLHTKSAAETISRVVETYQPEAQQQVRAQLAASVRAIVCQSLCVTPDGEGRVAAVEVMVASHSIRNYIRENKLEQIPSALQTEMEKYGSIPLDFSLAQLVREGKISEQEAEDRCADIKVLKQHLNRTGTYQPGINASKIYH